MYQTEQERRSAGAKRAANTRRLNAQRDAQRLQDALYARQKIEAERKAQAPIIEAERAANKEQWLHYWRSQIGSAITQADLNAVIKELADWGGYGGGFGSTFDPPKTDTQQGFVTCEDHITHRDPNCETCTEEYQGVVERTTRKPPHI